MEKRKIILHQGELKATGVEIKALESLDAITQTPHRDDHYMFIIQRHGYSLWELDFEQVRLSRAALCFVAPGQVHRYLELTDTEGWLVFVDNEMVPGQFRDIFDTYLNVRQSVAVQQNDTVFQVVPLLLETLHQKVLPLKESLIRSILETMVGSTASRIVQSENAVKLIGGQKYSHVYWFKQLVKARFRDVKQVKAYAQLLNVTPLYLNEMVKQITGFSASYWISREILLEAKRMLRYTKLDIRQVAYELGYEDHAYFSRFFKKHTGITALAFRNENHHLCNHSH